MHNWQISDADRRRWTELVEALNGRSGALTDRFLDQLGSPGSHTGELVRFDEAAAVSVEAFRRLTRSLAAGTAGDDLLELAREVGTRHARQGSAQESLLAAVRLDFSLIWSGLLELASPDDGALLASNVETVWQVVNDYTNAVYLSYSAEQVRISRRKSHVQQEFISLLFTPAGQEKKTIPRIADALGVDPFAEFTLVSATGDAARQLRSSIETNRSSARTVLVHNFGEWTVAFWLTTRPKTTRRQYGVDLIAGTAQIRCGLVPSVRGLAAVPAAAATACLLAEHLTEDETGPVSLEVGWARLAKHKLQEVDVDPGRPVREALTACSSTERDRLMETVFAYLRTGNVGATAATLFCHRNTVLNRLKRFHDLTGIDPTIPEQAASVVVGWA